MPWTSIMPTGGVSPDEENIKEWAQAGGMPPPAYRELSREGPDHAPVFRVEARLADNQAAEAEGRVKRQAEQAAAKALLDRLGAH